MTIGIFALKGEPNGKICKGAFLFFLLGIYFTSAHYLFRCFRITTWTYRSTCLVCYYLLKKAPDTEF